jgi:hypothetical protein
MDKLFDVGMMLFRRWPSGSEHAALQQGPMPPASVRGLR